MDKTKPNEEEDEHKQQQIWSWGAGTDGQLATGRLEDDHLPQLLHHFPSPLSSVNMLACGGAHVIALTSGGRVFTWGRGSSGQLGHGDTVNVGLYPKPVEFLSSFVVSHVSAGWNHSGFVSDEGFLFTCGDGSFGQLGHGDYMSYSSPVKVSYFVDKHVKQIECGMRHSIVLLKVYGFGSGKRGQLGISKDKVKSIGLPELTSGFEDIEIVNICANGDHSAALSSDGQMYTWGRGFNGALDSHHPLCLPAAFKFTEIALGWNHALVLTEDGDVLMRGATLFGLLSDSVKHSSEDSGEILLQKVPGPDGLKVVHIAAGAEHSALVTDKGAILTWGWGEHGQLGLGDTNDQINPQPVVLGREVLNKESKINVYCGSGFTYAIRQTCVPMYVDSS
ncbi:hypothetical protein ACFE04_023183 [Oxalis oulophora]